MPVSKMIMKEGFRYFTSASLVIIMILATAACKKTENPIKYQKGTFPDSLINITGLNTEYDDYNLDIHVLGAAVPFIFSSNRTSNGGQFDLVQGIISYQFDQGTGDFTLDAEMATDPFLTNLTLEVNTTGNDFGPYRSYSSIDGYEYMILSSVNNEGNLDFFYTKNIPYFGTSVPEILGPYPVKLLNSGSDDAYFCFDTNQDSAYFTSNADGNFDIYLHKKPDGTTIEDWFNLDFESSEKADELNCSSDDKCPYIYRKVMVFSSDRPGGLGGFDLYYSVFSNGKWGAPINFGSPVNTSSDEYRPVLGGDEDYTNSFLMFSSNRPGGQGGFDLYFTGINFPK
jgi:hypothetical protein